MAKVQGRSGDLFARSEERVFRVSELTAEIRRLLEDRFSPIRVVGEISGLTVAGSGHAYFQLKDERSTLAAVMFRSALSRLGAAAPGEGDEVECLGRLTMYEPRGRTQLLVEWMAPKGEGELAMRFLQLKRALEAEGLFDPDRKRPLPWSPRCVGVVTSPSGAAIRDILEVLGQRMPAVEVIVIPTRVQGTEAPAEIAAAIERAGRSRAEVVIIGRGGGSLEDLWAFNTEVVVRAVAACPRPTISAVGHETDLVLSDLAADVRAPTPSAAAERVVPDRAELGRALRDRQAAFGRLLRLQLASARAALLAVSRRMRDPRLVLAAQRQGLDEAAAAIRGALRQRLVDERLALHRLQLRLAAFEPRARLQADRLGLVRAQRELIRALRGGLQARRQRIAGAEEALGRLSPLAVLRRGYGLVAGPDGSLLRDAAEVDLDDRLSIRLHRGRLDARVTKKEKE